MVTEHHICMMQFNYNHQINFVISPLSSSLKEKTKDSDPVAIIRAYPPWGKICVTRPADVHATLHDPHYGCGGDYIYSDSTRNLIS